MDLGCIMAKGRWEQAVMDVGGLKHGERHQAIVRQKLVAMLHSRALPLIESGSRAHAGLGKEIDDITDAILANAQKVGLDIDGEHIDQLTAIAANLHAIQIKWKEILVLLTPEGEE